ncbi:MAG: hypothetical protein L3J35_05790 [Bacteroidales bacterium]|nr:hypothetical protein [Bacteroidales bacterium]
MLRFIFISSFIFILNFNLYSQISEDTKTDLSVSEKVENFEIIITVRHFGRKFHIVTVNQDSIIVERNVNNKKKYFRESRLFMNEEKTNYTSFLEQFPIEEFKESYYNKNVKDGTQLNFSIKINSKLKEIGIANYYIKELGELVFETNKLIHEKYMIWYSKENCPTEIEK